MSRPRFEWKYVTTGRMIDNKTGKIFDTKDECLCLLNDLERQLAEAKFAVKTLIGLNEIAYNEGYNDRQKHNKKDYEKTKSSLKVKQLKEKVK